MGVPGTSSAAMATVANVAPTVDTPVVSPANTSEGTETGFSVTACSPIPQVGSINLTLPQWTGVTTPPTDTAFVDNNTFSYSFNGNHTYANSGTYNVTVSVTDNDGDTGISNASSVTGISCGADCH